MKGGPHWRLSSPSGGGSTFMTSALISAISIVQMGPDRIRVRSTTNKSSKGLMYLFLIRQERPRKPIKFLDRQQPNFARKGPQKAQHGQTEKIVWVRFFCFLWFVPPQIPPVICAWFVNCTKMSVMPTAGSKPERAWKARHYPVPMPSRRGVRMKAAFGNILTFVSVKASAPPAMIMVPALYNLMPAENVALGWLN